MNFQRSAGILLHPTSLPGKFGIGDLGPEAFNFIHFLVNSGQTLWEVLPLGPTGYGDSPYQCFSAFAGNPYIISPEKLRDDGLLTNDDLDGVPGFDPHEVDFGRLIEYKMVLLQRAYKHYRNKSKSPLTAEFENFCKKNKSWLDDFALFMAVKQHHGGKNWVSWEPDIRGRKPKAVKEWSERLANEIEFNKFIQFLFFHQWAAVKAYANSRGIKIIGDLPIFIAYDSSDAWSHRHLFTIDDDGTPLTVAGVPPDYFSPTGQLWGNPLYRWDEMKKDDFLWWRKRIASMLDVVDIIRIDHFRGFEAYWEVPGDAATAEHGKWVKAPGMKFFSTLKKHLGDLPILAEDLGLITKPVVALRDAFDFPGMKILQFAFGSEMEKKFLPHNHIQNSVVYTGSHDNDTTRGFFEKVKLEPNDIYSSAQTYLNYHGSDLRFELIRTAYASVANIVVIPMQDVLNLGSEARMNFPGKLGGNWTWRFTWDQVAPELAHTYKQFTLTYERPKIPKKTVEEE
jgi:4-alpha-glucanotransferase